MKIACFSSEQHYRQNRNGVDVVIGAAAVAIVVVVVVVAMSFDGVNFFGVFTPSSTSYVYLLAYELFRLHDTNESQ